MSDDNNLEQPHKQYWFEKYAMKGRGPFSHINPDVDFLEHGLKPAHTDSSYERLFSNPRFAIEFGIMPSDVPSPKRSWLQAKKSTHTITL